jgi:alpha-tubulin suppressor-like RCC1 family protein
MNNIRSIFSIIGLAAVFLAAMAYTPQIIQISAGVVQSQKVTAPPVANDALVFFGSTGSYNIDYDQPQNRLVTVLSTDADWDMVACGDQHCLAIKDGKLYSWGSDLNGRTGLGNGTATTATFVRYTDVPTQIGTNTDWTHISAGNNHSLAISSGRLFSFGSNTQGQLGLGNTTTFDTPQQVGTDTDWQWCSAGNLWSAAIKGGQLFTCGTNGSFRTGLNTSSGNTTTFTVANSDTNWIKCFAGDQHGLAIKNSPAQLWSWGVNSSGRTGQNTTSGNTQVPTQVGSLTGWTTGSAGNVHSLAIRNDSLYVFGSQANGRLGNGLITAASIIVPTLIAGNGYQDCDANGNTSLTSFNEFSYAIRNDSLFATGINARGQLGITLDTVQTGTFRLVDSTNFNYKKVAAGSGFGVAIRGN